MQRRMVLLIRSDACGWAEVRHVLDAHPAVSGVREATSAHQAIDLVDTTRPDVIFAAERIRGTSTLSLLIDLRTSVTPESRIVVIARKVNPEELHELIQIGIACHLLWNDLSTETLSPLLSIVLEEDVVVMSQDVADAFLAMQWGTISKESQPVALTAREQAVLQWLSEGLTHHQIADEALISPRTVERIVGSLKNKVGAANDFVLGCKAVQLRLVADDTV